MEDPNLYQCLTVIIYAYLNITINSRLMLVKYSTEQLLHDWKDTGNCVR